MRTYLIAAAVALVPSLAGAGGYGGPDGATRTVVEVPCYPEDRFKLCPVPIVEGHTPGYLPRDVPSDVRMATADTGRFAIWVTPNVVPYELAVRDAAVAAAAHCGRQGTESVIARIDYRERYAPERLDAWKFAGQCE